MTSDERRLKNALVYIALGAMTVLALFLGWERLRDAQSELRLLASKEKVTRYVNFDEESAIARIAQLESLFSKTDQSISRSSYSISSIGKEVLIVLSAYGISPLRYQISGKGEGESLDFALKCPAGPFIDFLNDDMKSRPHWKVTFVNIKNDIDKDIADIDFKVSYE
jgi:hypothetical protein